MAIASCADKRPLVALPEPDVPEASAQDVTPPPADAPATQDTYGPPLCSVPADVGSRCTGSDPKVVFYPPIGCDPRTLDAATTSDGGPCSGVTPSDVAVTPDACRAFADVEAHGRISYETGTRAPVFVEPADGAALTPDEWSIFAWSKGTTAFQRFADFLEPSAHALTPLNGDGYVLEFSQGCTEVLRVLLASTFWAPEPASWNILTGTHGPVDVRVFWMKFSGDAIATGPVASAKITITMTH
jgi:hypothetical protein